MAVLLILLAIIGAVLVGDLVVENTAAGDVTVLHHPITGYSEGRLLATVATLGFIVGLLVVWSVSARRTRRAYRKQPRTVERDLIAQLTELERDNASLRNELAHRDPPLRRPGAASMPADLGPASTLPRPSDGLGSAPRRIIATPSRSTRRPGGSPASVAIWISEMCPLLIGHTSGGPVSTRASHCRHGWRLGG